ncbi:hypothetical protein VPNG_10077 [Cytospora leucostoma]|uniref:Uncharacterized protein n=1 Tax=Cytospora leucostoma TaxID=1230097 RepID=A0A423VJ37_9PEZI|nr:hypothetical protein VPNG_10077 [Cytospora leucostoma]
MALELPVYLDEVESHVRVECKDSEKPPYQIVRLSALFDPDELDHAFAVFGGPGRVKSQVERLLVTHSAAQTRKRRCSIGQRILHQLEVVKKTELAFSARIEADATQQDQL